MKSSVTISFCSEELMSFPLVASAGISVVVSELVIPFNIVFYYYWCLAASISLIIVVWVGQIFLLTDCFGCVGD